MPLAWFLTACVTFAAENHPQPGSHYPAFSKVAYLPDSTDGAQVLKLFELAFERKILFSLESKSNEWGQSAVQLVENGIPLKTINGVSSSIQAYPDPNYLDIAREALQRKGVF